MALKAFGERGHPLYHAVCSMYPDYSERETEKKFDSFNGHGITVATFFYLAKRDGVDVSKIARERVRRNAERFNWLKGSLDQNGKNNQNNTIFGNNNQLGSSEPMSQLNQLNQMDLPVSAQYTFSDKIKKENLPRFLEQFYDVYPDAKILDMILLAVCTVSSAVISFANGGENCKPKPTDTPTDNLDIDDFLQS